MQDTQIEYFPNFKDVSFLDVDDFYRKRKKIKASYDSLPIEHKTIYKWYFFFQLCLVKFKSDTIKKQLKEVFWEYINNLELNDNVNIVYQEFCEYRKKLYKKDSII